MSMKTVILLLLSMFVTPLFADELRFDEMGRMLNPDVTYLEQGIDSQGRGHNNDAMRYFKKSAQFGNPYAQSAIAFMHMQNKDYLSALAWFKLVDLKMIDKDQMILDLIDELTTHVPDDQQHKLQSLSEELIAHYGKQAALQYRQKWREDIAFGGSKIKGNIPGRLKIYPAGRIEQRGFGEAEIFVSSTFVSGEKLRLQLKEFIYDYEINFTRGKVSLQDVELIDD